MFKRDIPVSDKASGKSRGVYHLNFFLHTRRRILYAPLSLDQGSAKKESSLSFALFQLTPPSFVRALPPESGSTGGTPLCIAPCATRVNATPLQRDGSKWDSLHESKFFVTETLLLDPDPKRNVLRSVVSSLSWSLSHLPATSFDFSTFTCLSSANELGPPVNSSTLFRIECEYLICIMRYIVTQIKKKALIKERGKKKRKTSIELRVTFRLRIDKRDRTRFEEEQSSPFVI
ncbi:ig-like domain-containing protein [Trichonephila inaurata madagascariensis]|uniref:Ig-like domain-containing protein n=1 Tax=Trichonephila inaurata madagascariensis TaxID=2747483 RepID=A0A8X7BTI5_9ARAC|nr:ig-like domain-containing protein [Trichonephila inaurata madagascariensis]